MVRPAPRKNPLIACSGAPTLGPLRSSRTGLLSVSRSSTCKAKRRGVEKLAADL